MLSRARLANVLLVVFIAFLALGTYAQVRHNADTGPKGRAPHDNPISARVSNLR